MTNKEAIDRLSIMSGRCENGYDEEALDLAIKALEERPTGEWILHGMIYYCSNCGHDCGESGDNFCGNCGAKMKKEETK